MNVCLCVALFVLFDQVINFVNEGCWIQSLTTVWLFLSVCGAFSLLVCFPFDLNEFRFQTPVQICLCQFMQIYLTNEQAVHAPTHTHPHIHTRTHTKKCKGTMLLSAGRRQTNTSSNVWRLMGDLCMRAPVNTATRSAGGKGQSYRLSLLGKWLTP